MKTMEKDIKIITEWLMECDAFNPQTKLHHKSFRHLKSNLIKTLEEDVFKTGWWNALQLICNECQYPWNQT